MRRAISTEAIVLAATDVGEEDRILTFITPRFGVLRAAATSARSLKKGRTAPLDLFVRTNLVLNVPGREGKLKRITSAEMIEPFLGIRADYKKLCAASYLGQTVAHCIQEDDPSSGTFDLVLHCLGRVDAGMDPHAVMLLFEVKFLHEMGISPELEFCLGCGKEAVGKVCLDPSRGGVLHLDCQAGPERGTLSGGDVAVLKYLSGKGLSSASNLKVRQEDAMRIFNVLHPFTVHHLGYESRALGMLNSCS